MHVTTDGETGDRTIRAAGFRSKLQKNKGLRASGVPQKKNDLNLDMVFLGGLGIKYVPKIIST